MRIPRANDPSTDRRIEHLGDSWGMTPDRFLWSHIDARAVPARAARRILAPSQKSNLGSLVSYQLDCLDGNARRSCSCKQTPAAQPFVDVRLLPSFSLRRSDQECLHDRRTDWRYPAWHWVRLFQEGH